MNAPLIWARRRRTMPTVNSVGLMLRHLLWVRGLRAEVSPVERPDEEQSGRFSPGRSRRGLCLRPAPFGARGRTAGVPADQGILAPSAGGRWHLDWDTATVRELETRLHNPKPDAVVTQLANAVLEIERRARERPAVEPGAAPPPPTVDAVVEAPAEVDERRLGLASRRNWRPGSNEPPGPSPRRLKFRFRSCRWWIRKRHSGRLVWVCSAKGTAYVSRCCGLSLRELASEEDLLVVEDEKRPAHGAEDLRDRTGRPLVRRIGAAHTRRSRRGLSLPARYRTAHHCRRAALTVCLYGKELVEAVSSLSP